ncbi:hypothetical protein K502DRAFT_324870 [Neoconidiobolus thromboides FSU 785]|nr:hypothetical protein K502DRAFT_324870 [Neoconidiobolus thromboides FSU 785]
MKWYSTLKSKVKKAQDNYVQLSTCYKQQPFVRTVVVRGSEVIENELYLIVTAHLKSDKIVHLEKNNAFELCWYLNELNEQYRIRGEGYVVKKGDGYKSLTEIEILDLKKRYFNKLNDQLKLSFYIDNTGVLKTEEETAKEYDEASMKEKALSNFTLLLLKPDHVDHLELTNNKRYEYQLIKKDQGWSKVELIP